MWWGLGSLAVKAMAIVMTNLLSHAHPVGSLSEEDGHDVSATQNYCLNYIFRIPKWWITPYT